MLLRDFLIWAVLLIYFIGVIVSFLIAARYDGLKSQHERYGVTEVTVSSLLWPGMLFIIIVAYLIVSICRAVNWLYLNASGTYDEQNRS